MIKLLLATSNVHKLLEIRKMLPDSFEIASLLEIGFEEEIPETGKSFTENALQKARFVFERTGYNVIADDSGLCVKALDGRPGIFSARYAGLGATDSANVARLLDEMKGCTNRESAFYTVIALITEGQEYTFEGVCEGVITQIPSGENGFGYDPVFIPSGESITFAAMSPEKKNRLSHRGMAMEKLQVFLLHSLFANKSSG